MVDSLCVVRPLELLVAPLAQHVVTAAIFYDVQTAVRARFRLNEHAEVVAAALAHVL